MVVMVAGAVGVVALVVMVVVVLVVMMMLVVVRIMPVVMVARGTFHVPVAKFAMFTPKLSSVTVAENKNESRLRSLAHMGAKDAEYSI